MRVNNKNIDDWKTSNLGRIAIITNGKTNVQDAVIGGKYLLFDRSIEIKRSNKFLFDKTAIILPGEGAEFIPRFYSGKFDLHQRAYAIFPDKQVDARYLYYYIDSKRSYLTRKSVGSTVKSLRLPIIQSMPVIFPALEEQISIAKILSAVDEDIEKTDAVIEKTEKLKKGLMQQLFTKGIGHTKFKKTKLGEIPEEWILMELGHPDICTLNPEQIDPRKESATYRYIDIASVYGNKINEVTEFIGKNAPSRARRLAKAKDIIISTVRPNLRAVAYITSKESNYLVSTGFCVIRCNEDRVDPRFIYQIVLTDDFTDFLVSKTKGSNYPAVNSSDVSDYVFKLPPKKEQEKIADILSSIDEKISRTKKNKEKLIQLKKGLMFDLLSGNMRI